MKTLKRVMSHMRNAIKSLTWRFGVNWIHIRKLRLWWIIAKLTCRITNLQPFDFDPTKVDPREVTNTDQGAIDIDHISDHKCNNNFPKRRGLYTF